MPIFILLFLLLEGCQKQETHLHHFSWSGKFAHIRATIPGDSLALAFQLQEIPKRIEKTEKDFSPHSELSKRIFQSPKGAWIDLDSAAFTIMAFALEFRNKTTRRIDPAIGDLLDAWKISWNQDTSDSPPDTLIRRLVDELHNPFLVIDSIHYRVQVLQSGKHIAWGAYLEGYLLESIANDLERISIPNYLVEVGGDFVYKGTKPSGDPWIIGIKNPFQSSQLAFTLALPAQKRSLCTSGDYEQRFIDKKGKLRHHIIDPYTGYPSQYAHSVTVTSSIKGMGAHSLCTWFMTMPLDSVIQQVQDSQGAIDALLILQDSTFWASDGLKNSLKLIETQFKPHQILTKER